MNSIANSLMGLVFVIAFLGFAILWVTFSVRRLRPWIRLQLGASMGLTINERIRYRSQSWEISGTHSRAQALSVTIAQYFVDIGCMIMPLFCALAFMGILLMSLSEG